MDRLEKVAKIRTALGLFNSMINGGEQHSQSSRGAFHDAMNALERLSALDEGWTDEVPTVPGWYWYRRSEEEEREVVQVEYQNKLMGRTLCFKLTRFSDWFALGGSECQWSGPITPPKPEGE